DSVQRYGDGSGAAGLSAQCGVEAGAQVGEPLGGFVGEYQAQVPAAAGSPAIHRGGGDLGAGEQPPGCFPRSQAHAAGVDEQRPTAVRADARILGELVQDQRAALLPDPGRCGDIGAGSGVVQRGGDGLLGDADLADHVVRPTRPMSAMISSGPATQPTRQPIILSSLDADPTVIVRSARPRWAPGWTGGWPSKRIRSIAASQMTQARYRRTGPAIASKCSPPRTAPVGMTGLISSTAAVRGPM